MIAGFGYYGGRVTAEHMARRIGELASSASRLHVIPLIPLTECAPLKASVA